MKTIYFDNAATTPLRPEVVDTMSDVLKSSYGNPSSTHAFGRQSKVLLEKSRKKVASFFNASPSEVVFTSGGTEADNFAIIQSVKTLGVKTIITSKIEHHAVLNTILNIKTYFNINIEYVNLNANGTLDYLHLEELLRDNANVLVSLMHINNEIGTILDLEKVSNLCCNYKALFHTDAVQSVGHFPIDFKSLNIDFLSASAHKFHGPKGVGFCLVKPQRGLNAMILGGEQEKGLRAGTESIHNIVGLAKALELSYDNLISESNTIKSLKSYFISELKTNFNDVSFNGDSDNTNISTYTILNVRFPFNPNVTSLIQFQLDLKGIAVSRGSACQSGSTKQSHVLTELLNEEELKKPSIRFSFSIYNTKEEIDYTIEVLKAFKN